LQVTINQEGVPTKVMVIKSLRADYDQSALDAVRQWRFSPAILNGEPTAVETHIDVHYSMK